MLMMLAFRPSSGHRMDRLMASRCWLSSGHTRRSAHAHDAGFQAVEWPQEGRLMLPMLAFRPTSGHTRSADAHDAGFQAVE